MGCWSSNHESDLPRHGTTPRVSGATRPDGHVFALKGGTAINLFVRDMPRLSVDLDLVFSDHTLSRREALSRIAEAIRRSAATEGPRFPDVYRNFG